MITPAEFEDRMLKIAEKGDLSSALAQVHLLMSDTLDDLGYAAGIRVFREMVARRKQGDEHGA
jgi:hypothetical protein